MSAAATLLFRSGGYKRLECLTGVRTEGVALDRCPKDVVTVFQEIIAASGDRKRDVQKPDDFLHSVHLSSPKKNRPGVSLRRLMVSQVSRTLLPIGKESTKERNDRKFNYIVELSVTDPIRHETAGLQVRCFAGKAAIVALPIQILVRDIEMVPWGEIPHRRW